jgi:capsular exopolysaccharide synthesis family protein
MSRIEEALRRAMNDEPRASEAEMADAVAIDDAQALAREPFPLEMPDRRTVKQGPALSFAPAGAAKPVAAAGPAAPVALSEPLVLPPATSGAPSRLIERMDAGLAQKVVIDHNTMPLSREQYRRLAATLYQAQAARGLKVIMIGSALPGEGKTLTAANLALTFSESYKRTVLLIDADLRRPSQHQVFQVQNTSGLSEGLAAMSDKSMKVRQISERLALLPAGRPNSDPMAGLTSPRMHRLVNEARDMFDWVIIDTPPVGLLPDANLLATFVDGAILVVRAGVTPHDIVRRAVDALGRQKLLGVVLNRAERRSAESHYDYYDTYYGAKPEGPQGQ